MDLKLPENTEEKESELALKRHDCGNCGGQGCVLKDSTNIHSNPAIGLTINIPAHICHNCGAIVYEPGDYEKLLQAEEDIQGRKYVKVKITKGRIQRYSIH
jgi:hypothetical protein